MRAALLLPAWLGFLVAVLLPSTTWAVECCLGSEPRERWTEAQATDWAFHDTLIDSLGNDILSAIYRVNSIKIRLIRLDRVLLSPDSLMPALKEHGDIIAALRARDSARAVAMLERHLTSARNRAMGLQTIESPAPPVSAPRSRPRSAKVAR